MKHYFITVKTMDEGLNEFLFANVKGDNMNEAKEKVKKYWNRSKNMNVKRNMIKSITGELIKDWDSSWLKVFEFWTVKDLD